MLRSLHIERFRCFDDLRLDSIDRINLITGHNNVGKSCILEALELLLRRGEPSAFFDIPARRGEFVFARLASESGAAPEVELQHLFHGHVLKQGASFRIEGANAAPARVDARIVPASSIDLANVQFPWPAAAGFPVLALMVDAGGPTGRHGPMPVTADGGLVRYGSARNEGIPPVRVVDVGFMDVEVAGLLQRVELTAEKDRAIEAMQIIAPELVAMASTPQVKVRLRGLDAPVPLATMGDGMKRLAGLALSFAAAAGGTVLIDEIEAGFHYSVLVKMWRMVIETARRLGVQVFATTHSLECIRAAHQALDGDEHYDLTLIRLERGQDNRIRALSFDRETMQTAVEFGMEVR